MHQGNSSVPGCQLLFLHACTAWLGLGMTMPHDIQVLEMQQRKPWSVATTAHSTMRVWLPLPSTQLLMVVRDQRGNCTATRGSVRCAWLVQPVCWRTLSACVEQVWPAAKGSRVFQVRWLILSWTAGAVLILVVYGAWVQYACVARIAGEH